LFFQIKAFAVIWIDVWGFFAAAMLFGIYVLPSFPVQQPQGYIHIMFVLGCDLRWKTVLNRFEALNEDPRNKSLYVLLSKSQHFVVSSSVLSLMEARVSAIWIIESVCSYPVLHVPVCAMRCLLSTCFGIKSDVASICDSRFQTRY
jgi:hypothetical protein